MLRVAVVGEGERAAAVAAAIGAGSGMVLAEGGEGEAAVVAAEEAGEAVALTRETLARGVPTLCLALPTELAILDELAELAGQQGTALSLPNGLRHLPALIATRETLARGEAGQLLSAFASCRTSRAVGDPLEGLGPAVLDLLGWLLPGPIARAQVTAGPLFGPERGAAAITLRGQNGLVRTIELAASLPPGHEQEDELLIEILGEEAALRAEPFNQALTIIGPDRRRRQRWDAETIGPILDGFVAALRDGREPPDPPAQLRPTLALLAELRAAAASGEARTIGAA